MIRKYLTKGERKMKGLTVSILKNAEFRDCDCTNGKKKTA